MARRLTTIQSAIKRFQVRPLVRSHMITTLFCQRTLIFRLNGVVKRGNNVSLWTFWDRDTFFAGRPPNDAQSLAHGEFGYELLVECAQHRSISSRGTDLRWAVFRCLQWLIERVNYPDKNVGRWCILEQK
jgi:hypothetical protein